MFLKKIEKKRALSVKNDTSTLNFCLYVCPLLNKQATCAYIFFVGSVIEGCWGFICLFVCFCGEN